MQADDWIKLMQTKEPLLPILRPHVVQNGPLGAMLKHPLINSVVYREEMNAMINRQYKAKVEALDKAIQAKSWDEVIMIHERPWRINVLLKHSKAMTDKEYWESVSRVWIDSENVYECYDDWRTLWESQRPQKRFAMETSERSELRALPEIIQVYRGIHGMGVTKARNRIGLSWTIDRSKAVFFATAYKQTPIKVLEGTVRKSDVHAYFSRRNESEIVSAAVKVAK